ncbi:MULTISPECIES: DUF7312 domain-containing protein [Haloarcula]|uniref:DUF7312 domain-containing protein n=1 Tax=Haloarcula pellucida TaxID=1427151 RepID=A0A830GHR8_9EURY|nr:MULTISPECIES: hypothetical protein [Halomicroarcula]MBX0346685.1 hypothetical protein [Halomicroarcula pellucida]MDS0277458.1 hypothetical protein [Halomicroarcula sp. S1AR25-4]GGN85029.1 hypothetical protein GCM10009030_01040 [Halomicroarcula pellucida]
MAADGSDDDRVAESDDGFVEEYEFATEADVIDVEGETEGSVAGALAPDAEVTPGSPSLENVLFVALGVYLSTLVLGQMVVGSAVYAPTTLATITAVVAVGAAVCYALFARSDPDT